MKYILLILISGLLLSEANAQYLLRAGYTCETTCINDLDPDTILNAISNSINFRKIYNVDCNLDGMTDFIVETYSMTGSHGMWETKSARITSLNSNKIAFSRIDTVENVQSGNELYYPVAKMFSQGDTINTFTEYLNDTVYLAENSWVIGAFGVTIEDWLNCQGYLGLYLYASSKYYWVNVAVNTTTNVAVMGLLDECNNNSSGSGNFVQKIDVFPNPCHDFINIRFGDEECDIIIKLYNVNGQFLNEFEHLRESELIQLNISGLNKGIYYIQLFDQKNFRHYTRKIIIE